jgi:hypothetical protein
MGTPVICVGIQYRLGWLGFLASKDFEEENEHYQDHLGPGNWGIIDQRNAFLWIKKNISAFGGDPNNVTAFGVFPFPRLPHISLYLHIHVNATHILHTTSQYSLSIPLSLFWYKIYMLTWIQAKVPAPSQ